MPSLPQRATKVESRIDRLERQVAQLLEEKQNNRAPVAHAAVAGETEAGESGDVQGALLRAVHAAPSNAAVNSRNLAATLGVDHDAVLVPLLQSLSSSGVLLTKVQKGKQWVLTAEGQECLTKGSPEARLFAMLDPNREPIDKSTLGLDDKVMKVAIGQLKRARAVEIIAKTQLVRTVNSFEDTAQKLIKNLANLPARDTKILSKRKMIAQKAQNYYNIVKGDNFTLNLRKLEARVTCESWADAAGGLKAFNTNALGTDLQSGALHPLMKFRAEYRNVLISMGFEEMETNNFVESTFWNFDALFQPQQHPARDAHDTFYIADRETKELPPAYVDRVRKVHEKGGWRSIGYRMDWSLEEAKKLCLRTHTTAISARYLYKIGQQKPFKPVRCFSIDRVFRNETLDATHLAEFHQVEGFVADYDLNLGHLIGFCSEFFKKVGIPNVRFKPAYNPYTEPSMEIFTIRHDGKLMEVGNSGLFRPEMLRPMGIPEGVRVIAWGFGLERNMMKSLGEKNIRDLMGPKVKIDKVRRNPVINIQKCAE